MIWGEMVINKMSEAEFCEYAVVLYFTNFCLTMLNVCSANISAILSLKIGHFHQLFHHSKAKWVEGGKRQEIARS